VAHITLTKYFKGINMKIPIIILNYNSSDDCHTCVDSLKRQEGVETEIIIVDNLSPHEGEVGKVRKLCEVQQCTFIQATENRGYNAGNNLGLRYAAGKGYKYALIANPDMEFTQTDYLQRIANAMEEDSDIVVCGTDILGLDGTHQNPMKRDGDWRSSFGWVKMLLNRSRGVDNSDFMDDFQHSHYCLKVGGCCLMVRLDYLQGIGFFDERVFLYCEEAILSRQVESDGKKMYYLADVQALHRHIPSQKGNPVRRFRTWISSRCYFERTYNDEGWLKNTIKIMSWRLYCWIFSVYNVIKKIKESGSVMLNLEK
jgi:hypothetical protein